MWYAWLEAQRSLVQSLSEWTMRGHGTTALPELQGSRVPAAGFDWMYRFIQPPPEPPPFGISAVRIGESLVPVVEAVVDSTPFCALRKFTRAAATTASGRMRSGQRGGITRFDTRFDNSVELA